MTIILLLPILKLHEEELFRELQYFKTPVDKIKQWNGLFFAPFSFLAQNLLTFSMSAFLKEIKTQCVAYRISSYPFCYYRAYYGKKFNFKDVAFMFIYVVCVL